MNSQLEKISSNIIPISLSSMGISIGGTIISSFLAKYDYAIGFLCTTYISWAIGTVANSYISGNYKDNF